MRAEHWLHRHGSTDAAQAAAIKQELKDAFYPDAADWKLAVWQQGSQACLQRLEGLQEDASLAHAGLKRVRSRSRHRRIHECTP